MAPTTFYTRSRSLPPPLGSPIRLPPVRSSPPPNNIKSPPSSNSYWSANPIPFHDPPRFHPPAPTAAPSPPLLPPSVPPFHRPALHPPHPNPVINLTNANSRLGSYHKQLVNDSNQVGPGHDIMVRPFICKYDNCDRAFARKSDLARHFRIHTNERPFVCMHRGCGKAFIQRSALTVHTRVHTGERPHHCEVCNKAFADSSSLARHRRIHSGKRPYGCKVPGCNRQFARRNTYLKHFKRQHPELPPPTSSSVKLLHYPRSTQGFLTSGGGPGSVSDSEAAEYSASPSVAGPPHAFAAAHPPEGAAYQFNGGFVNGQLHSSQLAPANPTYRPYFHPNHPEAQGLNGQPGLAHPGPGGEQQAAQAADRAHAEQLSQQHQQQQQTVHYADPAGGPNGPMTLSGEYTPGAADVGHPVFPYQDPSMARLPNGMMGGPGNFYFKTETGGMRPFQPDPNQVLAAQAANWGGVGGGFAPGQLSLPAVPLQPSYQYNHLQQQLNGGQKNGQPRMCASPLSDRADSPELVDINAVPAIKYQPPQHSQSYPMPFSAVDPHGGPMQSPLAMSALSSGPAQLHSAPPHMQRFHSAPGVPTLNHQWNQAEPFKATTPGFENRNPIRRASAGVTQGEEWTLEDNMLSRDASDGEGDSASAQEAQNGNAANGPFKVEGWSTPGYTVPTRPGPFRFPSSASTTSTASSMLNVTATPQSLPPGTVFPNAAHMAPQHGYPYQTPLPQGWNQAAIKDQTLVTPQILGRPVFVQNHNDDDQHQMTLTGSPKMPLARDRQASGVSVVGLGISNVTFGDREGSIELDNKVWTPSESGSLEGEDELESDEDDDSDDDFVLGTKSTSKRKSSTSKRARGAARGPTRGMPKRRVMA